MRYMICVMLDKKKNIQKEKKMKNVNFVFKPLASKKYNPLTLVINIVELERCKKWRKISLLKKCLHY